MATWAELAKWNRSAAIRLFEKDTWRGCVSRAYYAVYSGVTDALLRVPVTMPAGREGPHHVPLPEIVGHNLTMLAVRKRWRLSGLVKELYNLRCLADYRPSVIVEEDEARITLGLMKQAFDLFEEVA